MNDKLDFKKEYKDLYLPGKKPMLIEVPPIRYLMADGTGEPNGESYQRALELLYALTFTIKMSKMGSRPIEGYFEYVVPPLEGLWACGEQGFFLSRNEWKWTSMIRQPDFVTQEVFDWACEEVQKKKGFDVSRARLEIWDEGLCAQLMHTGPYATEQASIDRLTAFIAENGLRDECGRIRRHHEIYLGDPRRTAPERLRTVIRHPVAAAEKTGNE